MMKKIVEKTLKGTNQKSAVLKKATDKTTRAPYHTTQKSQKSMSNYDDIVQDPTFITPSIFRNHEQVDLVNLLCDNHMQDKSNQTILKYYDKAQDGSTERPELQKYTYGDIYELSNKFSLFLRELTASDKSTPLLQKQDKIGVLLPKCPEVMVASLASWRLGLTYIPLFTAFETEAIRQRVEDADAKVIVTDRANRHKIEQLESFKNNPDKVIVTVESLGAKNLSQLDLSAMNTYANTTREYKFWSDGINSYSDSSINSQNRLSNEKFHYWDDNYVILYTSGTQGKPKGVMINPKSLESFEIYMRLGLYLTEEDVYFNPADTSWAGGLYYSLVSPLLIGKTTIFDNRPFNTKNFYQLLQDEQVTNLSAAPTAFRTMKAEGEDLAKQYKFNIQKVASCGEPMNAPVVEFFENIWNTKIRSQLGQTEHGMLVNNHHHPDLRSGEDSSNTTIGRVQPGFKLDVLDLENYGVISHKRNNERGYLALDIENSPSRFFKGYYNAPEKMTEKLIKPPNEGGKTFELIGDTGCIDEKGLFYFEGRADDVISSAGYRIGPSEVENELIKHPAVMEAGVVGKPDNIKGEIVVAFVSLKPNVKEQYPNLDEEQLKDELMNYIRSNLSKHQYPREIHFKENLPTTDSGKIKRNVLRREVREMVQ